jgi:anti-anti-sigma factor
MNKKDTKEQAAKLTINQDITIINSVALKTKIEEALNATSTLDLLLQDIDVIDLAGLQLIYAVKQEASSQNKELNIKFNLKDDLLETIRMAGFGDLIEN